MISKIRNYLKIKENRKMVGIWIAILIIIGAIYSYYNYYLPYKHLQEGYVEVSGFDCPSDHPIKAHLGSMIYHVPGDTYYSRTSADNGECFDTTDNAIKQGFRAPYN